MTTLEEGSNSVARGVYCLANDEALEWFQAFIRSFRRTNPSLPLTIIPYNSSMNKLRGLQEAYRFAVMDEAIARRFDSIAPRVAGRRIPGGTLRKLCCFLGSYETFLFLDSDIVVMQDLAPLFETFEKSGYDLAYFDVEMEMVYTPELAARMVAEYQSHGFNSGAFFTGKASVTEADILAAAESGEKVRDHFANWGDQPFINYLVDVTRCRLIQFHELSPAISPHTWAKVSSRYDAELDQYRDKTGALMPFLHWPGCEYPTMLEVQIFLRFRTLGMGWVERLNYLRAFYYLRSRRLLKRTLLHFPFMVRLFNLRNQWLARREQQHPASTV